MIKILKASAGSGKTYNLAKTYIRLLLTDKDRYAYRHILAVTFTNKATDEMKNRILKELSALAKNPQSSPYYEDLLPEYGETELLRGRADRVLCDILHDYSAFSVSTIDRFFQQTLKAFSREIGQFSSYQVELDKGSLVEESVGRVLDSLSEDNPALLEWLTQSVMDDIRQGNRYNLENNLNEVALSLMSDEHRSVVEEYDVNEEEEYSKTSLARTKKALSALIQTFRKDVKTAAEAFVKGAAGAGISKEDFSGKTFDALYAYADMGLKNELKAPSDSLFKKSGDFSGWFRKADQSRFAFAESLLMPFMNGFLGLFGERYRIYCTAGKIIGQLSELGIAGDLRREFNALMKEKNVLSLDDSNLILRRIIDGSDAPFIYEKLGVRFEHFLLDEFQDTSRIQWDNFKPLIKESDSNGKENLLVGDVKQSIYRWRGSDWRMMAGEVEQEFPGHKTESLDSNYRSLRNIVEFNNGFFAFAAAALDGPDDNNSGQKVSDIYSDERQMPRSKDKAEGNVEAVFCKEEEETEMILKTIEAVRSSGARYGDITVLVRDNHHGSDIALYLMSKGISVISDDSLHLKSSVVVRQLVSLLSSAGSEGDSISSFLSKELGIEVDNIAYISLLDLSERLLRSLKEKNTDLFESDILYVQSFMDFVQDYVSLNGNSIDGFLKSWDESDPKISSPSDPESVRVMTIHKSKGLEFPYVILPYSEKTRLFLSEAHWVHPEVEGTVLEGLADGVYHVTLTKPGSDSSLFRSASEREMRFQCIDNINTFYVALTRAVKGLTVISKTPPSKILDAAKSGTACDYFDFSQILYVYLRSSFNDLGFSMMEENGGTKFCKGTLYDFALMRRDESEIEEVTPGYPSFPLNPEPGDEETDARERGRLKFKADSVDFFKDEMKESVSARINGTVLHDILSSVIVPSDLPKAVQTALSSGIIDEKKAQDTLGILSKRIAAHSDWFPERDAEALTEASLIDTDGREYRPDRVVLKDGEVIVIDYKFGEKNPRYKKQVSHYADIYRRMGFPKVSSSIWYVIPDEVE